MDNAEMLTPKEVGKRIKERRNEIGISMPELGRRVGVNKSTIQRYETDGVNPNRSMIINGLADALQTTPGWLTGLSEEKEVKDEDGRTICEGEVLDHLNSFWDAVNRTVQPEVQRRFLTSTLCLLIDLFSITAQHYGRTLNEIDLLVYETSNRIKDGNNKEVQLTNKATTTLANDAKIADAVKALGNTDATLATNNKTATVTLPNVSGVTYTASVTSGGTYTATATVAVAGNTLTVTAGTPDFAAGNTVKVTVKVDAGSGTTAGTQQTKVITLTLKA